MALGVKIPIYGEYQEMFQFGENLLGKFIGKIFRKIYQETHLKGLSKKL